MRGKRDINLTVDPPPDLIIEVDITSPSLNKFPIYAALGVPEIWRYGGQIMTIFRLEGGGYVEAGESVARSRLTSGDLSRFVGEGATTGRREWLRGVRAWARGQ